MEVVNQNKNFYCHNPLSLFQIIVQYLLYIVNNTYDINSIIFISRLLKSYDLHFFSYAVKTVNYNLTN